MSAVDVAIRHRLMYPTFGSGPGVPCGKRPTESRPDWSQHRPRAATSEARNLHFTNTVIPASEKAVVLLGLCHIVGEV
jgi:hypothetical protein